MHICISETRLTHRLKSIYTACRFVLQIYAIDLRNHGESPWRDQMDYDIMAADIARFIREVVLAETGFDKSNLLGM